MELTDFKIMQEAESWKFCGHNNSKIAFMMTIVNLPRITKIHPQGGKDLITAFLIYNPLLWIWHY